MYKQFFASNLYVKIYKNKIVVNNLANQLPAQMYTPDTPFTSTRLLVGNFASAAQCLRQAVKSSQSNLWLRGLRLLIQPMEMNEGGLCEVEEKIFRELGVSTGARKVVIWIGAELAKDKAIQKINN